MSVVPSQDQVMAQLRIIIPALGTIVTAIGVSSTQVNNIQGIALASVGPIAYLICGIWSLVANTREAKIKSVQDIATGPAGSTAVAAQTAIIRAAGAIAQNPTIPTSDVAAHALINATIALPQVQTIVTDKKTADASPSPSVVAASPEPKVA
jgi:hypothetical protein